ncbi:unnamed protein product [Schistosoma mattheei]|uniref:Uncharacterized protein n=1 Tax=Schistosoma mattheei TaxID=31246 RepID=A0A3P8GFA3_9TREM|nr:unnamed protein product [Schistosoma mattheei]
MMGFIISAITGSLSVMNSLTLEHLLVSSLITCSSLLLIGKSFRLSTKLFPSFEPTLSILDFTHFTGPSNFLEGREDESCWSFFSFLLALNPTDVTSPRFFFELIFNGVSLTLTPIKKKCFQNLQ